MGIVRDLLDVIEEAMGMLAVEPTAILPYLKKLGLKTSIWTKRKIQSGYKVRQHGKDTLVIMFDYYKDTGEMSRDEIVRRSEEIRDQLKAIVPKDFVIGSLSGGSPEIITVQITKIQGGLWKTITSMVNKVAKSFNLKVTEITKPDGDFGGSIMISGTDGVAVEDASRTISMDKIRKILRKYKINKYSTHGLAPKGSRYVLNTSVKEKDGVYSFEIQTVGGEGDV